MNAENEKSINMTIRAQMRKNDSPNSILSFSIFILLFMCNASAGIGQIGHIK